MKSPKIALGIPIFIALAATLARGAGDVPERQDLFAAGGAYETCRIPGLIVTPKGSMLAYCEARKGSRGDWADIDLLVRRSTDGGRTWSPQHDLIKLPDPQPRNPRRVELKGEMGEGIVNARTYHNCIMIPDRDTGAVHCIFCLDYWRCFYMRSDDDGATFGPPREITDVIAGYRAKGIAWRVVGNGTGNGIQLSNGRLVESLWLSPSTQAHGGGHRPGNVGTLYSDDHGATWKIGDLVVLNSETFPNPSETCEVELSDGRVYFNTRIEGPRYRRSFSISPDGATGWSAEAFDDALFDPWCEASLLRVSTTPRQDRNRILFCNPDSRDAPAEARPGIGGKSKARRNLTIKLSYDDCRTWPVSKVVDPGVAGYSDMAVAADGTLFCLYERGTTTGSHTATAALTLVRFNLAWLTDGRDIYP